MTGTWIERMRRWPTGARIALACALCALLAVATGLLIAAFV